MARISSTLALGAGCYWGTEKYIVTDFQSKKYPGCIANAKVGFMSPDPNAMKDPSYRQVCTGKTGHVEVLNIELTPEASTPKVFEDLIKFFFSFHDPTTLNRQGNDVGTQYSSVIFCSSPEQKEIARKVTQQLQAAIDQGKITTYQKKKVETAVVDYTTFYEAQEDHQEYLMKNPLGYCNHRYRFQDFSKVFGGNNNDPEL
ncbi:bifunctional methionine sulfoxide reductase [Nitzschia inconspicua]|uniref:Bifunctional methionine sulfoxide reductase n=1 Tax=Nitzschia inconspicua TaxID=303405 RepID=A0A9K3PDK5_9STRA|nr:bifunctional methionine sulfoxide reductase [Nitzschia inconspicua]